MYRTILSCKAFFFHTISIFRQVHAKFAFWTRTMGSHCDATIWFSPSANFFFPFIFRDDEKKNQIANSQGVRCESFAQTITSIDDLFKLKHFCQPTKPVVRVFPHSSWQIRTWAKSLFHILSIDFCASQAGFYKYWKDAIL